MPTMTSHERFEATMRHTTPDRVPLDIGGTSLTGMRPRCQEGLRRLLGFEARPQDETRPLHGSSHRVDERILQWIGTDFRSVGAIVDLPSAHTRRISPQIHVDCWGVRREFIDGDWQITESPLRGASREDLETFQWPEAGIDDAVLEGWVNDAKLLNEQDEYVVVAEHPVYGILELGCWMCGYDDFLLKLALDPDFVRTFFEKTLRIQSGVIEQYYPALAPYIDLTTSGDDFGSQDNSLMSPGMFKSLVAPYFSERITRTKELGRCYYWHHSCGSIVKLLDQIIDCGVDILNPLQTSAGGMAPGGLKDRFGDRIVFWGAVDVQQFLPQATPEEIPDHINALIDILGANGGYVMAPAHEIQDDVPPENILAWVETLHRRSQESEPAQ